MNVFDKNYVQTDGRTDDGKSIGPTFEVSGSKNVIVNFWCPLICNQGLGKYNLVTKDMKPFYTVSHLVFLYSACHENP